MDTKKRLKWIRSMTGNSTNVNKVEASEDIINKHLFNLPNYKGIFVDVDNNWETESNSRILRRWLHTHIFLSDFTRAYYETGDEKYFFESFSILESWFKTFPIEKRNEVDELAYHDEGTARRLLFWFKYYNQFFDLFSNEQIQLLNSKIDETAELLTQKDFYAGSNNHGLFQDMSLIAYSLYKYEDFEGSTIFKKSLSRIENYFKEVFSKEGIHKEHAPSYHVLLIYSLKQILEALKSADIKDGKLNLLSDIYRKGENYIVNVVMPDYKLPNISDSSVINMSTRGQYKNLYSSEAFKFITSYGKEGKAPTSLINVYPDTGYLIARNKWEEKATYFLFLASYHMHYHKHTDDLSFILYKNGPIFIDAGPHSYNYKDPYTRYAYSQFAHSTMIVNNHSLPRTDFKFDHVYIANHSIKEGEQQFSVTGVNSRYENVKHIRDINGNFKNEEFIIKDTIISDERNQYKILYQINGDLQLVKHGHIFSIFKNNSKIAELEVTNYFGLDYVNMYVITEQEWPQIMGYQFPKSETKAAANTLVIESYNSDYDNVFIESKINLKNFKITGSATFDRRDKVKVKGDVSYVYEDYGHKKMAVIFSPTNKKYKYPIESYDELFDEKGYNLLYIKDDQFVTGSSFVKGKSNSTIENDIIDIISIHINKYNFSPEDVLLFGKSKAGFAALYYGLKNNFRNIIAITPLTKIGDYYSRHEMYHDVLRHLSNGAAEGDKEFVNNLLFNIDLDGFSKMNNVYIGIGEKDYNKKKHITPLLEFLKKDNISFEYEEFKDIEHKDTMKVLPEYLFKIL